ncbi:MAG: hypothetical protein OEQ12_05700 [Nitrosopumilus sp.]|nr:hypothetical protein [Nitrosopumilus sp.]
MSVQKCYTSDPITSFDILLVIMKNHVFTKRKGISTVLTTVIILVASVVLGSGVVLYGTSLFQTVAQEESIEVQGIQVWVNATDPLGDAWGAAGVRNNGDQILAVDTISIKGTIVPFSSWYWDTDQTRVTAENWQAAFIHEGTDGAGTLMNDSPEVTTACPTPPATTLEIDFDGGFSNPNDALPTLCLEQGSGPVGLKPGERTIIYFQIPLEKVTTLDAGASTTLKIFADKAGAPISIIVQNP